MVVATPLAAAVLVVVAANGGGRDRRWRERAKEGWFERSEEWGGRMQDGWLRWCCGVSRGRPARRGAGGGGERDSAGGGWPGKKAEEGGLGGWLVMHCANSPRPGHVTRTPGLSLIAPRRNVGHTVPTKHCTLHLASFRSASSAAGGVVAGSTRNRGTGWERQRQGRPAAPSEASSGQLAAP